MPRPTPRLNPVATEPIELDLELLSARSAKEWARAHSFAKRCVFRWAWLLGSDVDDVVQDALLALRGELDALRDKGVSASAALRTLITRRALNALRSQRTRAQYLQRAADEPMTGPRRPDAGVEERALERIRADILRDELANADDTDRQILLGKVAGLTGNAIAATLGLSPQTVSDRWLPIKAQLARRLVGLLHCASVSGEDDP